MKDITDVSGLVNAATAFRVAQGGTVWWRGEPAGFPTALVPSMLRVPRSQGEEGSILLNFRQRAHARASGLPDDSDQSGWLFLMQHHGLPTRLLDWTENPLAGLYFAVEVMPKEDGFIWGLFPMGLNDQQIDNKRLLLPHHDEVKKILNIAFAAKGESGAILAVMPVESDLRMLLQQGRYTIHGNPGDLVAAVGEAPYLGKWRVPATAKAYLKKQLEIMGVSRSLLFPDLASLAADMDAMAFGGQEGGDPTEGGATDKSGSGDLGDA